MLFAHRKMKFSEVLIMNMISFSITANAIPRLKRDYRTLIYPVEMGDTFIAGKEIFRNFTQFESSQSSLTPKVPNSSDECCSYEKTNDKPNQKARRNMSMIDVYKISKRHLYRGSGHQLLRNSGRPSFEPNLLKISSEKQPRSQVC